MSIFHLTPTVGWLTVKLQIDVHWSNAAMRSTAGCRRDSSGRSRGGDFCFGSGAVVGQ
jgi:hypothetical protein